MLERRHFDVLVLGGGAAGCVLAARLSEDPERSVGLVEAGPDYGALAKVDGPPTCSMRIRLPASHDWQYDEGPAWSARVMGGCSTHNACLLTWGADGDYDESGGTAASAAVLEPYRRRAEHVLAGRVREAGGAWHETVLRGAVEAGFPYGTT